MAIIPGRGLMAAGAAVIGVAGGFRAHPEHIAGSSGVSHEPPAAVESVAASAPPPAMVLPSPSPTPTEGALLQVRAAEEILLPTRSPLQRSTPVTPETPAPTVTVAPWAIPVRVPMDSWIARPRPPRDVANAATRLDPSSLAHGLAGITFAGPELTASELLTGQPAEPGAPQERTVWSVEVAYTSDHRFDEVVAAELVSKAERGFRVILRVDYARKQPIPPPGDPEALQDYVATFARLHRMTAGHVRYYLVGNEGNVDSTGDDPSRVTECLAGRDSCAPEWYVQVYRAVRAALRENTDAYLIVGAPSPGDPADPTRWAEGAEYLRAILGKLHPLEVDALALHAYGGPADQPDHGLGQFARHMSDQLEAIEDSGLLGAPVFVTEINQESAPSPTFVRSAYEWLDAHNRRSRLDVVAACWFVYHDATGEWPRYALESYIDARGTLAEMSLFPAGR
jgi:hypothetical protein